MAMAELEKRIAQLEAIEEIRRLKALYCLYCDQNYDPEALVTLFTEDAVWDAGPLRGVHRGREAIRTFFAGIPNTIPYAAHLVTNPLIDVDGDTATGQWRMLMPCTMVKDRESFAVFQVAEYKDTYRRIDGKWMISHLEVRLQRLEAPELQWQDLSGSFSQSVA